MWIWHGHKFHASRPEQVEKRGIQSLLMGYAGRPVDRPPDQTSSSFDGMIGKKMPPERRPNQRVPSTSWSSPISTRR